MNSFTLKFYDDDFEKNYTLARKIVLSNHQLFLKVLFMLLIILIISEDALNQLWVEMIYNMIGLIILITSHYFKCYLQEQFHEICLVMVILIYNISSPTNLFLTGQLQNNSFSNGYFVSLATIGVVSPMDFIKKLVITILLLIIHLISTILSNLSWTQILIYFTSNFMMIYYFYFSEKESRLTFIGLMNKTLIEDHFYKEMELQSFAVHYNQQQNSFHLVSQNQINQIDDETQFNFIQFIRRIRVMVGYQGSHLSDFYSQEQINICRKLNLEQFLFYLFTNELKLQHLIYHKSKMHSYQMIGLVGSDLYQIKLIKTYDTQPCVIILIKQNRKESQKQQLKLKLKIANKQIELSQHSIHNQLRMCLINLKYLFAQNNFMKKIDLRKFLKLLNSKITKVYNDINNLADFNDINGKFNKIEQNYFDIEKEIQDCIQILENLNYKNSICIELHSKISNKHIFSDQKKVKQLILNLLFLLIKNTSKILIKISECVEEDGLKENLFFIEMIYQGQIFTQEKIHNFPVINPQNIEELKHNNSKQIDYEISIALMIVRQLGPYNQIKFKQGAKSQNSYIQFYLFQELQQFNLIPIISFPTKQYLICNQNFQKKQSQTYKSIDLQNKTFDAQLQTFRNLNEQMITKM